jgi:hypothetical protein
MAIIHIAIHDSLAGAAGLKNGFVGNLHPPRGSISAQAAIAQGAHDTLVSLYPSQAASFDLRLAEDLALVTNPQAKANGITLGHNVASTILADRASDGVQILSGSTLTTSRVISPAGARIRSA